MPHLDEDARGIEPPGTSGESPAPLARYTGRNG
jgi:hypothetical protein